jgi:transporter family-2 protein
MSNFGVVLMVAVIGGVAVTLQAQFMAVMEQAAGTRESVFVTYASGGLIIAALMLLAWRGGNLSALRGLPPYAFLSGVMGLVIVGSIAYVTPRMGLVAAFTIMLVAQFASGMLVDHWGLLGATVRPLEWSRIIGLGVLLLGAWLTVR